MAQGADTDVLRARIRQRLAGSLPTDRAMEAPLAGLLPHLHASHRLLFPSQTTAAAVLVPIVDRNTELNVLLTQRSTELKHHGGQISFPGGRLEAGDADACEAALREMEEEISLDRRFVEVVGYLPDQLVISGYRVTPVVGLVNPGFQLRLDRTEVIDAFEVPLTYLLDPANHRSRKRQAGGVEFEVYDIPWQGRSIWGATAGILVTLFQLLTLEESSAVEPS